LEDENERDSRESLNPTHELEILISETILDMNRSNSDSETVSVAP
jgi:hypothetical protein